MSLIARIAVLASGGGRTLENLYREIAGGRLRGEIVQVIVSREDIGAQERAARLGLPCRVIGKQTHAHPVDREAAMLACLDQAEPDLIVMAGWLQLLAIPERYEGRVLNIHPSLLPAYGGKGFYGEHVHRAVARDQRRVSGCTVHFATEAYDEGPVVLQEAVLLPEQAEPEAIADAVFEAECRAYPAAIRAVLAGRARWESGKVSWS